MVQELKTLHEFNDFINKHQLAVVDFTAAWCGPCKRLTPKFEQYSTQYKNWAFAKVDVDILPFHLKI